MRETPSNSDDIIDSRDVIARIEELRDERDSLKEDRANVTESDLDGYNAAVDTLREWIQDYGPELEALEALQEEAEGYSNGDWPHGATLIRDSYFTEYAEQLAEDLGRTNGNQSSRWPFNCIDWERAASELQSDYTAVEFDGVTYWVR